MQAGSSTRLVKCARNKNKRKTLTYFGNLAAELQLHRTLQFRSAFSLNKYNTYSTDFQSAYGYLGAF